MSLKICKWYLEEDVQAIHSRLQMICQDEEVIKIKTTVVEMANNYDLDANEDNITKL